MNGVYLLKVVCVLLPCYCALGQLHCQRTDVKDTFLQLNTTTETANMSCSVPTELILDTSEPFKWQWFRLASGNTLQTQIIDGIASERNVSVYAHLVECNSSGFYQALYSRSGSTTSCLFSCYFVISDVRETRLSALKEAFSVYSNDTVESNSSDASVISRMAGVTLPIGLCASSNMIFILPSRCTVQVSDSQWYRNGVQFEPELQDYILSAIGEVVIRNLSESTVGYYVCVTTVRELGESYQVVQANIVLAPEVTTPPLVTSTSPSITTPTILVVSDNPFGVLEVWQFGLVIGLALLVIIGILLGGVVWMGGLMVVRRRRERSRRRRGRGGKDSTMADSTAADSTSGSSWVKYRRHVPKSRPRSMLEEIQMLEEGGEDDVDVGMSSSPVEIPFSSILFEELLHKGTFKVVHHGVVNQPDQGLLGLPVAVKRLKDEKSELGYEELMNEALFLRSLQEKVGSHPGIVTLLGLTTEGGPTCLLLDFIPNGTLEDFLVALKLGPIPEWYIKFTRDTLRGAYHKHVSGDLMSIIMQVTEAMKFLTDSGFIHRDLSTRNILMGERLNIKVANPGMYHEGYYYVVSEREHFLQDMAPECLWEKRYSVCSDIWSFGILVYKIVSLNTTPFPGMVVDELHSRMVGGERPQLLASFSNEMYFLLQRCWQFVATERPSFSTIASDLAHMATKPTRHIILKSTKDPAKPGHISDSGQVFLRALPPHVLEEDEPKKARRSSGTLRSLISSIDDTVYTRETAETVLDFTQSETDNETYNNYERYLKGELPLLKTAKRQSYEETDTSGNDGNNKTRSSPRKSSKSPSHDSRGENADDPALRGGKAASGSGKRRKKRSVSSASRDKAHKSKSTTSFTSKVLLSGQDGVEGSVGVALEDSGDVSSHDAPSTEEEEKEENKDAAAITSDLSASDNSQTDLVRL